MTSPTSVETYVTKWAKEKLQDGMYAVSRYFGKSTVKNGKKLRYFNTHHSARTGYYCKRLILCIENH
jgi:hypothetical protein